MADIKPKKTLVAARVFNLINKYFSMTKIEKNKLGKPNLESDLNYLLNRRLYGTISLEEGLRIVMTGLEHNYQKRQNSYYTK